MAARLRHIALSVPDPERAAVFFEQAFGMTRCGLSPIGIYVTDGTLNIALLKYPGDILGFPPGQTFYGVTHFGMWVDDLDAAAKKVEAAGATHAGGHRDTRPGVFYEVKYKDPNGVIFDLTTSGWKGAVKEVVPADKAAAAE